MSEVRTCESGLVSMEHVSGEEIPSQFLYQVPQGSFFVVIRASGQLVIHRIKEGVTFSDDGIWAIQPAERKLVDELLFAKFGIRGRFALVKPGQTCE